MTPSALMINYQIPADVQKQLRASHTDADLVALLEELSQEAQGFADHTFGVGVVSIERMTIVEAEISETNLAELQLPCPHESEQRIRKVLDAWVQRVCRCISE